MGRRATFVLENSIQPARRRNPFERTTDPAGYMQTFTDKVAEAKTLAQATLDKARTVRESSKQHTEAFDTASELVIVCVSIMEMKTVTDVFNANEQEELLADHLECLHEYADELGIEVA